MANIYLATSWRNEAQPALVERLRREGHEVYDFRNPPGGTGFAWSQVPLHGGANKDSIPAGDYLEVLDHPIAKAGFRADMSALFAADIVLLVLPCERDAHLELGWAVGAGKETVILLDDPCKASLMYLMVDHIVTNTDELLDWLSDGC